MRVLTVIGLFSACIVVGIDPVSAQDGLPFVEQSVTRFPQPDPLEYSSQVAFGDVDGDGDQDIAIANGRGYNSATLTERTRLLINDGAGHFTDETDARTGGVRSYGRDVEFGDVDDDGDLDMVVANDFATRALLFINDGTGFFSEAGGQRLPPINLGSPHICLGDVENDGDLDLYFPSGGTSRFGSGQNQLWINDGTGHFADATAARLPQQNVSQPMDCIFGDVDGDLDLDLLVGNRANNSKLYLNDGAGVFSDVTAARLPPSGTTYSWDFGDIDGDGDLDALGANSLVSGSKEALFVNNGHGFFSDQTNTLLPGSNNPAVDDNDSKFFDIDDDGDLDFIIASLGSSERICTNDGTGHFTLQTGMITAIADSSLDVEVGDLNGDGRLDVVTVQGESGSFQNRIFINNGPVDTHPPTFTLVEQPPDILDPFTPGPYPVRAIIRDGMTSDRGFIASSVVFWFSVNCGVPESLDMAWMGQDLYRAAIPSQPAFSRVEYWIVAADQAGNVAESARHTLNIAYGFPGDFDFDGDFDLVDHLGFSICVDGRESAASPGCHRDDLDLDCDVDLADFAGFANKFGE